MIRVSELANKEIINIKNGSALGVLADIEFNPDSGKVTNICLDEPSFFRRKSRCPIPWDAVKTIGKDMILVEADDDTFLDITTDFYE